MPASSLCQRSASGRRKLPLAVAIVGQPPVLLMDDLVTCLDLFANRTIFKKGNLLRRLDKSAVLLVTTNLCDAVVMSDSMSIMVDGQLHYFGLLDELRVEFCRGFTVRLKLKPNAYGNPAAWTVDGSVKAEFPKATFVGHPTSFVEYGVDWMPLWMQRADILIDPKSCIQAFTNAMPLTGVILEHVLLEIAKYQDVPIKAPVVPS
ncbi:ABC transporter A family member 11-like [Haemaphysalis longicornis]